MTRISPLTSRIGRGGIWLDGTMQIMDREDILLSDRIIPAYFPDFPDDRRSASEGLASMVAVAKIYDRILTLADEHGLHVGEDEFSALIVSSDTYRNSKGREEKRVMLWFECDDPNIEGVADRDIEIGIIRENMPPAMSYYHDSDGFTVIVWDTKAGTVETYVFDDGRPTAWYFSPKNTAVDAWWRKILTVGENTAVGAAWIRKHIKRHEVEEESARLAYDFILCLEEMRGSGKGSPTWEHALSDARGRLIDLCDLAGVPAEEVVGFDI